MVQSAASFRPPFHLPNQSLEIHSRALGYRYLSGAADAAERDCEFTLATSELLLP